MIGIFISINIFFALFLIFLNSNTVHGILIRYGSVILVIFEAIFFIWETTESCIVYYLVEFLMFPCGLALTLFCVERCISEIKELKNKK